MTKGIQLFSKKYLENTWIGIISSIILIGTNGYMGYHVARHGDPDSILIFFVTAYSLFAFKLLYDYPKNRNYNFSLVGTFVILAIYTKSVAGIAPLLGVFIFFIINKKFLLLLKKRGSGMGSPFIYQVSGQGAFYPAHLSLHR